MIISTLSKVLIGTTAALAATTTVMAVKDHKASKEAQDAAVDLINAQTEAIKSMGTTISSADVPEDED